MRIQTWSFVSRALWIDVTNVFLGDNDILRSPGPLSQSRDLLLYGIIGGIMFASRAACMSFFRPDMEYMQHVSRDLLLPCGLSSQKNGV